MKKTLSLMLSIALALVFAFTCVSLVGCGDEKKFVYVALKNNDTGFTTDAGDTAIAIGVKKGSTLLTGMNAYLDGFSANAQSDLMAKIVALQNDENATYTPAYDFTNANDGTLKVGMECAYPPFNWTQNNDSNGALPIANVSGKFANGYDVQVAAQVAASMNLKLEIYMYEWDSLIPSVKFGTLDAIVAGMSPTEERKTEIDFSTNYYQSNLVVITTEGSKIADKTSLSALDIEGVKIAAQPGTFHLDALKAQTSKLEVIETYKDFNTMKIALESGIIDGYIAEEPTAMAYCK